jgi:hypothetical protein
MLIKKYFKKFKCWWKGHDLIEVDRASLIIKCLCSECGRYYAYHSFGVLDWDVDFQRSLDEWKIIQEKLGIL